jgi:hypothetical protein
LKFRITLVIERDPSMGCRHPKSEFFAENYETLETLGPKIQNAWKCNMKLVGGVLKEFIH